MESNLSISKPEGFEEVDHTADWAYHVWGESKESLFTQATLGMYFLADVKLATTPRIQQEIHLKGMDSESLLIAWLNELIYWYNSESLAFDTLEFLQLDDTTLTARVTGAPVQQWRKDIKAATYHNLAILPTETGFAVTIVLDV